MCRYSGYILFKRLYVNDVVEILNIFILEGRDWGMWYFFFFLGCLGWFGVVVEVVGFVFMIIIGGIICLL